MNPETNGDTKTYISINGNQTPARGYALVKEYLGGDYQ